MSDESLVDRVTRLTSAKKGTGAADRCMVDLKEDSGNNVEKLEYERETAAGATRKLVLNEDGDVYLLGREPLPEIYGLEDETFSYHTDLRSIDMEDSRWKLREYNYTDDYEDLDELLYRVEDEFFGKEPDVVTEWRDD